MGHLIVEQVVTVDGYAEDADGGISFFGAMDDDLTPNEPGQVELLERVDAILLGRRTYGMFADYWPKADSVVEPVAEPIARLPKYVASNTLTDAPWGDGSVEILRGDGAEAAAALKDRFDAIVVWGSLTLADALLDAGLVDELRLRLVPVLIGEGRSFTPNDLGERRLQLDHVVTHPSGHVGMTYRLR